MQSLRRSNMRESGNSIKGGLEIYGKHSVKGKSNCGSKSKGRSGKTTTTSNLGVGLARQGKKVLLIDADAQGNLTSCMGIDEPDELEDTLADIMNAFIAGDAVEPDYALMEHEKM